MSQDPEQKEIPETCYLLIIHHENWPLLISAYRSIDNAIRMRDKLYEEQGGDSGLIINIIATTII